MKRRLSILSLFYIILFSGCAVFEPAEEFDPEALPPTAAGSVTTVTSRVISSADDAEQNSSGKVSLTSSDLELTTDRGNQQVIGLRFQLDVPQGATIVDASIQFTVDEVTTGAATFEIFSEATDDAVAYSNTTNNISNRPTSAASVSWSPDNWSEKNVANEIQRTPSLATITQEVVSRSGWNSGNFIAYTITGTGTRTAEAYNGVSAAAPLLIVSYVIEESTPPPVDDLLTVTSQVVNNKDDAEEDSNGVVVLSSSDLEITEDGSKVQSIGIRFKLDIPKGALIESANIQFTSDAVSTGASNFKIYAEAIDNSAMFSTELNNISNRSKTTSSVNWSPADWNTVGLATDAQKTPLLSTITQEVVSREGWSGGNYISYIITGTGKRVATAYNKSASQAPKLEVTYTLSGSTEPSPEPTPPPSTTPIFGYQGLKYDPLVKPVYDQAYRDGFMSEDKDGDGLPDSWEIAFGLDPTDPNDAASMDKDQDLLTAKEEFLAATSPIDPDSDGDGLPDGYEVIYGLDPTNSADALLDLDGDGYSNLDEYLAGTDPTNNTSFPIIVPITYTVEIGWDAPTTREDGSNLPENEVAAFIVHYGTQIDNLSNTTRIDDPAARSTQVVLSSPGTYYFSVSVLDTNNAESNLSTTQPVTVGQ